MCGIVGYVGSRPAVPVLMEGLSHLEYRGYDSAGIAFMDSRSRPRILKEKGPLNALKERIGRQTFDSRMGIGHTRWATHGEPSRSNAHPHCDASGTVTLVHNGIIENYIDLKKELTRKGIRFRSETDTEVAANLMGLYAARAGVPDAFRKALKRLKGFFSFVAISEKAPGKLLVFKRSNPLCIGIGRSEHFVASDVTALLPYTHRVIYLEDDDIAEVTAEGIKIYSLGNGRKVTRRPVTIRWNLEQARKGGYPHYMLKEMHEQPEILEEVLSERVSGGGKIFFDSLDAGTDRRLKKIEQIRLVSCGTAYHASMIGAVLLEEFVRIPAAAQVSSEFRYGNPVIDCNDLVILITQSGETADTLAALREARRKGAMTLAIVNVLGSTIARESDAVIYTHAGPEIGVASTKAYTAQLMTLTLLTLYLGRLKKKITPAGLKRRLDELRKLPAACWKTLKKSREIEKYARSHYKRGNFLYLGRGYNFPTALEGALKLKEITYAHAHGYAAGEMKHGPIALIDRHQLVICIAPKTSRTYDKMVSNIAEIHAREGIVMAVGTERDRRLERMSETFFSVPRTEEFVSPVLTVIPLQLFAYYVSVLNGRNVDQPRNLAKSVTVE